MRYLNFSYSERFQLENGQYLARLDIAYQTWGKMAPDGNNVIWICHALTANSDAKDWWPGLIGQNKLWDPKEYFIVCANMIGSCYGSTEALSINPETNTPYFHDFPALTNRDIVRAFDLLRRDLGIQKIALGMGGSLGGQQLLEWALIKPDLFQHIVPIATNAFHSPWGIAFNEAQRMAISADHSWKENKATAGLEGMRAARAVALLSYRGYSAYLKTQTENTSEKLDDFRASSYQQYQGDKLAARFHAFAYWTLSKAMDSHNVGRARAGVESALQSIRAKTLVIGIDSDVLFPVNEQKYLAKHIPGAIYKEVPSHFGHDGFLIEVPQITTLIEEFFVNSDARSTLNTHGKISGFSEG